MRASVLLLSAFLSAHVPAVAEPAEGRNIVESMFIWWNGAMQTPGALTPEAFRRYFTEDAEIIVNGRQVAQGIAGFVRHFENIRARGDHIEKAIPFKDTIQSGDTIYTYQMTRTLSRDGKLSCALTAGYAKLQDGKIRSYVTVRAPLELTEGKTDSECQVT